MNESKIESCFYIFQNKNINSPSIAAFLLNEWRVFTRKLRKPQFPGLGRILTQSQLHIVFLLCCCNPVCLLTIGYNSIYTYNYSNNKVLNPPFKKKLRINENNLISYQLCKHHINMECKYHILNITFHQY